MNSSSTELVLANAATALAVATDFSEVKHVRDVAETIRTFYMKVGENLEEQNKATELKLRAERVLGQMLSSIELGQGKRTDLVADGDQVRDKRKTLRDLEIKKSQSSRWQMIASLSDDEFESYITENSSAKSELTTAGMLRYAKSLRRTVIEVACHQPEQPSARIYTSFDEAVPLIPQFSCIYVNTPAIVACDDRSPDAVRTRFDAFDALAKLPVTNVSSPNAHLHLWVEDEQVADAIWLINQWGFTFVGCFVWVKPGIGHGRYWRRSHQLLFTGVRGDLDFKSHSLRSWQEFPVSSDGDTPEGVRRLIEAASPGPYLELFGDRPVAGWHVVRQPTQSTDRHEDATNSTVEIVAIGSDSLRG